MPFQRDSIVGGTGDTCSFTERRLCIDARPWGVVFEPYFALPQAICPFREAQQFVRPWL